MPALHLTPLTEARAEDLALFATLRRRRDLERSARFVAEGLRVVERLLESDFGLEALLVTEKRLERLGPLLSARDARGLGDPVQVLLARDRDAIEAVIGFGCRDGVKAVGRVLAPWSLARLLALPERPRLLLALDGLNNAENLGVVVRNAAGLGAQGLIVGETACSPFLTRAIGTSMGTVFGLPVVEDVPLGTALAALRAAGVRVVAAHPHADGRTLAQARLEGDVCVVLGGEGFGISEPVLAACDEAVAIPMAHGVDSLNVASAAAVFLHETRRRQAGAPRSPTLPSGPAS